MKLKHDIRSKAILNAVYNTIKNVIGAVAAILIAQLLGLSFPLSAGIIAILSLLDSRKETMRVGIKRIVAGCVSLIIASILFEVIGYNLVALAVFILLVSFLSYVANSAFSIASSLVLAGHLYQTAHITTGIFFNEVFILLIGVVMGFLLTLHMPDDEKYLKDGIEYVQGQYKNHLIALAQNLKNHCMLENDTDSLFEIEKGLKKYIMVSERYKNNLLFGENFDYHKYFDMRLEQVYRLMHMKEKMEILFVSHHEADKLSEFTENYIKIDFCAHTPCR